MEIHSHTLMGLVRIFITLSKSMPCITSESVDSGYQVSNCGSWVQNGIAANSLETRYFLSGDYGNIYPAKQFAKSDSKGIGKMDLIKHGLGFFVVLFGVSFIAGCATQSGDVVNGPPPGGSGVVDKYLVGVDDTLAVSVWRNPELSVSVVVRPDGKITVPVIGDVVAVGKTPEEVAARISERLSRYIRNPQVAVSVTQLVSNAYLTRVRVTGAVVRPVSSPHRPGMTVLDAVLEAGGMTEFASPDDARLYRKVDGKIKAYAVRLKQILQKGNLSTNYELLPGDIISIPERSF